MPRSTALPRLWMPLLPIRSIRRILNDERGEDLILENHEIFHYGVKGMKWGVRKEYEPHPRKRVGKLTEKDMRRARYQGVSENDFKSNNSKRKLSPEQKEKLKKIAIGAAIGGGLAAGAYLAYRYDAINRINKIVNEAEENGVDDPFSAFKKAGSKVKTPSPEEGRSLYEKQKKARESIQEAAKEKMKNSIKEAMTESIADVDMILKEGQIFHRVEAYSGRDYSKAKDATYVSMTERDRYKYMAHLFDWSGTGERYEQTLQAIKEIRAPSKETARKIFKELWDSDPEYKNQLIDTITDAQLFALKQKGYLRPEAFDPSSKFYNPNIIKSAKDYAKKAVDKDPFGQAIYSIVRRKEDSKKLINKLQEHGYSAVEDYFDKGVFSESPLILLDPSSTVVKIGEERVTDNMKSMAKLKLTELSSK